MAPAPPMATPRPPIPRLSVIWPGSRLAFGSKVMTNFLALGLRWPMVRPGPSRDRSPRPPRRRNRIASDRVVPAARPPTVVIRPSRIQDTWQGPRRGLPAYSLVIAKRTAGHRDPRPAAPATLPQRRSVDDLPAMTVLGLPPAQGPSSCLVRQAARAARGPLVAQE